MLSVLSVELFGEEDELFVVFALIGEGIGKFADAAAAGPFVAESITKARRDEAEEELGDGVVEKRAETHKTAYLAADRCGERVNIAVGNKSVAVREEAAAAVEGKRLGGAMEDDAGHTFKAAEGPDVVVADKEMDLDAAVCHAAKLPEDRGKGALGARDSGVGREVGGIALPEIFVPKIEDVSEQKDGRSVLFPGLKEGKESALVLRGILHRARAEVGVGDEINHKRVQRYNKKAEYANKNKKIVLWGTIFLVVGR